VGTAHHHRREPIPGKQHRFLALNQLNELDSQMISRIIANVLGVRIELHWIGFL
jgi:hypothetical protein